MSLAIRQLVAVVAVGLTCAPYASTAPRPMIQRGTALVLETRFSQNVKVQAASLTWQTFDEISPKQKGMARAFHCEADIVASADSLTLSCKVPLDIADGDYYLTSMAIRANDFEQKYDWTNEPFDVHVKIKGGQEAPLPRVKSVLLK